MNNYLLLCSLPDDLVIEILEWLPVKSLVRFKCVAKHWSSVFKTLAFIQNHRRKQEIRKDGTMLLIRRCLPPPTGDDFDAKVDMLSFHSLDSPETLVRDSFPITFFKDIVAPRPITISRSVDLVGSCNGIVCFRYFSRIILCNPALRHLKILPPNCCYYPPYSKGPIEALGFGVTSCSCGLDFKFVVLRRVFDGKDSKSYLPSTILAHLYSSKTDSWKQVDDALLLPTVRFMEDVVFLNGACHWLGRTFSADDGNISNMLLSLDINSEVFTQLELPDSLCRLDSTTKLSTILLIKCSLGLIRQRKGEPIDVWVMKEYGVKESWTKTAVISPQPCPGDFVPWKNDIFIVDEPGPSGTPGESRRLGYDKVDSQLISISMHTNTEKKFQIYGFERSMRVLIHEESLVSLD